MECRLLIVFYYESWEADQASMPSTPSKITFVNSSHAPIFCEEPVFIGITDLFMLRTWDKLQGQARKAQKQLLTEHKIGGALVKKRTKSDQSPGSLSKAGSSLSPCIYIHMLHLFEFVNIIVYIELSSKKLSEILAYLHLSCGGRGGGRAGGRCLL